MTQSNSNFYIGDDIERVFHPEEDLIAVANIFVGTIDGENVGAISFVCPICQGSHQVSALMPPELVRGSSGESQLLASTMLVTFHMAMNMVSTVIKEAHGVEIQLDIQPQ